MDKGLSKSDELRYAAGLATICKQYMKLEGKVPITFYSLLAKTSTSKSANSIIASDHKLEIQVSAVPKQLSAKC